MTVLKPWARGPFELILHAEKHLRDGGDFDRRMAHIGFDNSIEVSISTYLSLHPIHRGGKQYQKKDVENWVKDYHTKLEFLEHEMASRGIQPLVTKEDIVWYHDIRNKQYHGEFSGIPEQHNLQGVRKAAIWVFSILYDISNVEGLLEEGILAMATGKEEKPQRDTTLDKLLDLNDEVIMVGGQPYLFSEVLYAVDPESYFAELALIEISRNFIKELKIKYPNYVRSNLVTLQFVHHNDTVYFKTIDVKGDIELDNMAFITAGDPDHEAEMFSKSNSPDENANVFLEQLDPFSIINCTDIFSEQAAIDVADEHAKAKAETEESQ